MTSKPETIQIFAIIPCWLWVFVLLPMFMPFLGLGLWEQWELSVWLEIGYHVANGLLMLVIIFSYLKEEWFMVTTDVSHYLKHVILTVVLIAGAELLLLGALFICGVNIDDMLECLPIVEMSVSHTPLFTVELHRSTALLLCRFSRLSASALYSTAWGSHRYATTSLGLPICV